ncbi:MAG: cytochrome bd ubiquinol oxidase subunit [Pseudonocardiales bacterium]|nr:cytochrome bd ubiquinol oxidase subunit [Pseudonocardiales bacterium]
MSTVVASILFLSIVIYGVFGGADFGIGFWDLTAGGAERGRRPRALMDHAIGPVWEANHTWLIFCLVLLWTGFPLAFAAIMTTLYIPLGIAAFGIVLRGSGFAFRKVAVRTVEQRLFGVMFATSSVLTPFCFGAVVGGIASGRVPTEGHGDAVRSWLNPTSLVCGVLAVLICAYLAAVFLMTVARRTDPDLEQWARLRAIIAAILVGVDAALGILVLNHDAHRLYRRLIQVGWPLLAVSPIAGILALVTTARRFPTLARPLGVLAVTSVIGGWGVAQYPYLLGTHLRIQSSAAPAPTLDALGVVAILAVLLVVPSLIALFVLTERGRLHDEF